MKPDVVETPVPVENEQAADLAALTAAAAEADEPAPGSVVDVGPPAVDLAGEISGGLLMLSKIFAPMFPTTAALYTEATCQQIGAAVEPVCKKHGWLMDGIASGWGPEIVCAAVLWPTAFATVEAIKVDIAKRSPAPLETPGLNLETAAVRVMGQVPDVGAKIVQFGTVSQSA